jgi:hypothetical protein
MHGEWIFRQLESEDVNIGLILQSNNQYKLELNRGMESLELRGAWDFHKGTLDIGYKQPLETSEDEGLNEILDILASNNELMVTNLDENGCAQINSSIVIDSTFLYRHEYLMNEEIKFNQLQDRYKSQCENLFSEFKSNSIWKTAGADWFALDVNGILSFNRSMETYTAKIFDAEYEVTKSKVILSNLTFNPLGNVDQRIIGKYEGVFSEEPFTLEVDYSSEGSEGCSEDGYSININEIGVFELDIK